MKFIRWFETISLHDIPLVGGKSASLGEMIQHLAAAHVPVPGGFALTTDAYRAHLASNNLEAEIERLLTVIHETDFNSLKISGAHIRSLIAQAPLPSEVAHEVQSAYQELEKRYGKNCSVALRSSATAEDLPGASFAGQQETLLNICGADAIVASCPEIFASLFTDRAIMYRRDNHFSSSSVALSIGVQKMVRSDSACSGVMFTLDTESGYPGVVFINASYGLGEYVVQGIVDPDEYYVHKEMLKKGFRYVLRKQLGHKTTKLIYGPSAKQPTVAASVSTQDQERFALTDAEVVQLAEYGVIIEHYYSEKAGRWMPMDIEWAKDGIEGKLYIVQARPETVYSTKKDTATLVRYTIDSAVASHAGILASGSCVGDKIAFGVARIIATPHDMASFKPGEILVTDMTDPDWVPIMRIAAGIVTNRGGRTCHAAIVSRELGIPAVIGTGNGTESIPDGAQITIDCSKGTHGLVYEGEVPFKRETIVVNELPAVPCKMMLNIGNPSEAFRAAMLPSDGVGLARLEFIINSSIQIHPMALVHPERVLDYADQQKIQQLTAGYTDKKQFFIDKLAQEAGTIAAAFYPRPVIVRLSDFKSNEYRRLIAGDYFEPHEENPMLGFRGASRYYHPSYQEAFALECAALKKMRDEMGLTNVQIMVPFVRTVVEGTRVVDLMARYGLVQGADGLRIIMMCEIPSNVVLIDDFSKVFDGFSIGSNDLTQLMLGIDRDSSLVAPLFDEQNPAVLRMLDLAIQGAIRNGRSIGICGQAPSDYPELARHLCSQGISSLSLSEDALIATRIAIGSHLGSAA